MNLPEGFYKLGLCYINGFGVAKNEPWGVDLWSRAVNFGHMGAANDLGVVYFDGLYNQPKDTEKAYVMFVRAAELGNAEAMKNIGVFYRDGIGRPADKEEELMWYTLALRAGFQMDALVAAVQQLRQEIGEERAAQVDQRVQTWIENFQSRQGSQS